MTTRSNGEHHHGGGPPSYQQQQRRPHYGGAPYGGGSASFRGCCCCIFLLLTFLALLALAVALVVVLVVKPRKPQFDLNQVSVQYLLVTPPSSSAASAAMGGTVAAAVPAAAYLSLNITLLFTAVNPNKVGIRYGATAFDVMYHGVPLGVAAVPGFEQPAHSTRLLQTRVIVDRFNVLQADAQDLVRDAAISDRVDLRITGDVGAKILVLGFSSPKVQVSVDCAIAISPRRQSLTYKQCGVDGLSV
uniref:Late embryogenesis abundant protein LEA-2 subgroup domain-containing protein n=1 Tax=Leersia perrieri TaxID=77586 RepID=A0A0D9VS77_9ORYZ